MWEEQEAVRVVSVVHFLGSPGKGAGWGRDGCSFSVQTWTRVGQGEMRGIVSGARSGAGLGGRDRSLWENPEQEQGDGKREMRGLLSVARSGARSGQRARTLWEGLEDILPVLGTISLLLAYLEQEEGRGGSDVHFVSRPGPGVGGSLGVTHILWSYLEKDQNRAWSDAHFVGSPGRGAEQAGSDGHFVG